MTSSERPNILFIYLDQLRADCVGYAGNPDVKTPNINRLANEGVSFEKAFVSYPLCTPFRASMLTGKYAHATGLYINHFPIPTNQTFLPSLLKEAGYQTGYIGKWHLYGGPKPGFVPPGPDRLDFDHFVGYNRGHEYLQSIFYRDTPQPYVSDRYEPDYQTDQLIEFMENCTAKDSDDPFFGYVCFGPPHFPMDMPEHWRSLYDPDTITLPRGIPDIDLQRQVQRDIIDHEFSGDDSLSEVSKTELTKVPPGGTESEAAIRKFWAEYYGMITGVDFNIGRILNWLDSRDLADNTMVVFFSDHGDMAGQHGHYCGVKRRAYKAAMQVPVAVRLPSRFAKGQVSRELIDLSIDTMPTILELCGLEIPGAVQGVSYLSHLDGVSVETRDHVFYEHMLQRAGERNDVHPKARRGIRTKDWLYVREKDQRRQLFDLRADPHEENNLVDDPAFDSIMDALDARIVQIMTETDDDWDKEMSFPPPDFVTHADAAEQHRILVRDHAIRVP